MKPKDIFSLAIRLVGLFFICLAARTLVVIFSGPPGQVVVGSILSAAFYTGVGWWLLGGAALLMQRAYPEASSQPRGTEVAGGAKTEA